MLYASAKPARTFYASAVPAGTFFGRVAHLDARRGDNTGPRFAELRADERVRLAAGHVRGARAAEVEAERPPRDPPVLEHVASFYVSIGLLFHAELVLIAAAPEI